MLRRCKLVAGFTLLLAHDGSAWWCGCPQPQAGVLRTRTRRSHSTSTSAIYMSVGPSTRMRAKSSSEAPKGGGGGDAGGLIRLAKMLAHAGVASRRAAEDLIEAGRVSVNGDVVREVGTKVDTRKDKVMVDGKPVRQQPAADKTWVMVNKPKGVIASVKKEENRKTLLQLVPEAAQKRLLPIGRLGTTDTGLLLLTNDLEAINLMTHRAFTHNKVYKVVVKNGIPPLHNLQKLAAGLELEGGKQRSEPLTVEVVDLFADRKEGVLMVTAREGRTDVLREAFAQIGHPVKLITRVAWGPLQLPNGLDVGGARNLSGKEMTALKAVLDAYRKKQRRKLRKLSSGGSGEEEDGAGASRKKADRKPKEFVPDEDGDELAPLDPEIEAFWDAVEGEAERPEDGFADEYDSDDEGSLSSKGFMMGAPREPREQQ